MLADFMRDTDRLTVHCVVTVEAMLEESFV